MKKQILATLFILSTSAITLPVSALDISPAAQSIIDTAIANGSDINASLAQAMITDPALSEPLLAAAISSVGAGSTEIPALLQTAIDGGLDSDTVIAIAIAYGVDPTLASEATAAGGSLVTSLEIPVAGGGTGGGGGGGGISGNQ